MIRILLHSPAFRGCLLIRQKHVPSGLQNGSHPAATLPVHSVPTREAVKLPQTPCQAAWSWFALFFDGTPTRVVDQSPLQALNNPDRRRPNYTAVWVSMPSQTAIQYTCFQATAGHRLECPCESTPRTCPPRPDGDQGHDTEESLSCTRLIKNLRSPAVTKEMVIARSLPSGSTRTT